LHFTGVFLKFISNLLVKRVFCFLFIAAFTTAMQDLVSCVQLATFVIMLPKQLKYSTFSRFDLSLSVLWTVALRLSLPHSFQPSFPFHSMFQFKLVYQTCPVVLFVFSHFQKVILIFHNMNYLFSCFEASKPIKSSLGKVLATS
jgi:hypothetical protein